RAEGAGYEGHVDALAGDHGVTLFLGERARRVVIGAPRPAVFVVQWHPAMPADRMIAARRNEREARHDPLRDAPVVLVVLGVAARADIEPARRLHHFEVRREV